MGWSCGTVVQFSRLPSTAYLAGEIPLPWNQAGLNFAKLSENDITPAITMNVVSICSESVCRIVCISGTLHVRHEHNILWNSCTKYLLPIQTVNFTPVSRQMPLSNISDSKNRIHALFITIAFSNQTVCPSLCVWFYCDYSRTNQWNGFNHFFIRLIPGVFNPLKAKPGNKCHRL